MQCKTEDTVRTSASRPSKRGPTHDIAIRLPQNPFLDRPIQRLAIKGFWGIVVQLYHVGARFEGLDALVLTLASVLHCFFYHPNFAIWKGLGVE